jgi:hypothetical protein
MGQDRYRLAPVRDERERNEAIRRGNLASAIDDARSTETALAAARARTAVAREALSAALATHTGAATAASLAAAERFSARRRRELAAARDAELRAELAHDARLDQIDVARGTFARARADREVIERHFARWRDDQRKLRDRRED